jgi:hypothetical protein
MSSWLLSVFLRCHRKARDRGAACGELPQIGTIRILKEFLGWCSTPPTLPRIYDGQVTLAVSLGRIPATRSHEVSAS